MYKQLPSTQELVDQLKSTKQITARSRWARATYVTMILAIVAMLFAVTSFAWGWTPRVPSALVAYSSMAIALLAWTLSVVFDIFQNIGVLINPARELAHQLDSEVIIENEFLGKFRAIPTDILQARHY